MAETQLANNRETGPLAHTERLLPCSRQDLVCIVLLLLLSWYVRTLYQAESITDSPLRGDAGSYAAAAFNLKAHSAFSKAMPSTEPPASRTDLAPGYALFLTRFLIPLGEEPGWALGVKSVRAWQAILGSLTVVCTYLLARQVLAISWSLVAGMLTCLSPHLIAINDYLLTETLFMFVMTIGLLVAAFAWRRPQVGLIFAAGLLLSSTAEIRYIALALPLCLLPLVFWRSTEPSKTTAYEGLKVFSALLAAWIVVQAFHAGFVRQTVANGPQTTSMPSQHFRPKSPTEYLSKAITPPNFFVEGRSHIGIKNPDPQSSHVATELAFSEAPLTYLRWIAYGRFLTSWHFDNAYNGDVYIYPMFRRGFEEHVLLKLLHRTMHLLHWPLLAASLGGLVLLARRTWLGRLPCELRIAWLPALALIYFIAALSLLAWLPRYSIPARPLLYILAAYSLASLRIPYGQSVPAASGKYASS